MVLLLAQRASGKVPAVLHTVVRSNGSRGQVAELGWLARRMESLLPASAPFLHGVHSVLIPGCKSSSARRCSSDVQAGHFGARALSLQ